MTSIVAAVSRSRVQYFDVLRAVAILTVVMIHAAITEWHEIPVTDPRWEVLNWFNGVPRLCVPIFFMVSGALFLDPARDLPLGVLFRKYLLRIVTAFAVWSLFFALIGVYGPGGDGSFVTLVSNAFTGHFHLWFLLALIGMYLAVPILRVIVRDRRVAWYFVGLALPFAYVFPLLELLPGFGEVLGSVLGTMQLQLVLGFSSYFLLGYLLSGVRLNRRALWFVGIAGVAGMVATVVSTSLISRWEGEWDETFYSFFTPNVLAASVGVFCLAKAWGDRYRLSGWALPVVGFLSTYSFGIFLVHPFFQWLYRQFGLTTEFAHPLVSVPVLTLLVLIPSALTSVALQRIPRAGRYLA